MRPAAREAWEAASQLSCPTQQLADAERSDAESDEVAGSATAAAYLVVPIRVQAVTGGSAATLRKRGFSTPLLPPSESKNFQL